MTNEVKINKVFCNGQELFGIDLTQSRQVAKRKLCVFETLSGRLGQPEVPERVAADFIVQDFEQGTVLYYGDDNQTYVLLLEESNWAMASP